MIVPAGKAPHVGLLRVRPETAEFTDPRQVRLFPIGWHCMKTSTNSYCKSGHDDAERDVAPLPPAGRRKMWRSISPKMFVKSQAGQFVEEARYHE